MPGPMIFANRRCGPGSRRSGRRPKRVLRLPRRTLTRQEGAVTPRGCRENLRLSVNDAVEESKSPSPHGGGGRPRARGKWRACRSRQDARIRDGCRVGREVPTRSKHLRVTLFHEPGRLGPPWSGSPAGTKEGAPAVRWKIVEDPHRRRVTRSERARNRLLLYPRCMMTPRSVSACHSGNEGLGSIYKRRAAAPPLGRL